MQSNAGTNERALLELGVLKEEPPLRQRRVSNQVQQSQSSDLEHSLHRLPSVVEQPRTSNVRSTLGELALAGARARDIEQKKELEGKKALLIRAVEHLEDQATTQILDHLFHTHNHLMRSLLHQPFGGVTVQVYGSNHPLFYPRQ